MTINLTIIAKEVKQSLSTHKKQITSLCLLPMTSFLVINDIYEWTQTCNLSIGKFFILFFCKSFFSCKVAKVFAKVRKENNLVM